MIVTPASLTVLKYKADKWQRCKGNAVIKITKTRGILRQSQRRLRLLRRSTLCYYYGMENDFDRWNEIKKRIAIGDNPNLFPKTYDFYYNFTDPNNNKGSVILAQVRLVSVKRFIRDMYKMNKLVPLV